MQKYNNEDPGNLEFFRDRAKQTSVANYGVEYPSQSEEIKHKIKETNLERYGVEYTYQSDIFKEKSKQTMLEKYGVPVGNVTHLTPEQYNNLTDPAWLTTAIESLSIAEIAEKLNVDVTTVYNRINKFGIRPNLGTAKSQAETTIADFIRSLGYIDVIQNDRTIIKPKELDIVIPSAKLAIEYCGLYWHSDDYRDKNYHKNKLKLVNDQGLSLITIFEDEWLKNPDVIRNAINHKLSCNVNKIYARNTTINQIFDKNAIEQFYQSTHIQGWDKGSTLTYGLIADSAYVAMMSFEKYDKDKMYLTRYATSTHVVGGASKLLNYFFKNNLNINQVISFADLRWSDGNLYKKLGFRLEKIIPPDYQYIIGGRRHHKFNFRKDNLKKYLNDGVDIDNITESDIMKKLAIPKIWDCGKLRYVINRQDLIK